MAFSRNFRNLALLTQGQLVTNLGNQVFDIAMLLWIKQATGSAALMGLAMLFSGLPEALLAPFGGAVADRYGRLRIIIAADLLGAATIGLVLLAFIVSPPLPVLIGVLCIGNGLLGIGSAAFGPAVNALVPSLAGRTQLERANAALQFSQTGGRAVGQGLGGLLFGLLGFAGTMALNGVTFLFSAWSETRIQLTEPDTDRAPEPPRMRVVTMIGALLRAPRTRVLLLLIAAFHLCLASLPISLPYYVEAVLDLPTLWFGAFMAVYSIGILAGFVVAGALPPAVHRGRRISVTALLVALAFGTLSAIGTFAGTVMALAAIGIGIGVIIVNLMTELQIVTAPETRATAMGAAQMLGGGALPVGMALTGLLLDALTGMGVSPHTGVTSIMAGAAGLAGLAAVAGWIGMRDQC